MTHTNILIECAYGMIELKEGASGARYELEWTGDGVKCYLTGKFSKQDYWAACNLLNNWCQDRNIPLHTVRRVKHQRKPKGRDTNTRSMF